PELPLPGSPPQRIQRAERGVVTTLSAHEHTHRPGIHTNRPEEQAPGPSEGAVFVEVGEGVGAAVIRTGPDLDGAELEIRPASGEWRGVHTAVRERRFA